MAGSKSRSAVYVRQFWYVDLSIHPGHNIDRRTDDLSLFKVSLTCNPLAETCFPAYNKRRRVSIVVVLDHGVTETCECTSSRSRISLAAMADDPRQTPTLFRWIPVSLEGPLVHEVWCRRRHRHP